MISRVLPKIISGCFAVAAAILLCVFAPFGTAQTSGSPGAHAPQLDYEFFKTRVEPIFLKSRSADHARCYVCHQVSRHGGGPLSLDLLSPGMSFWTDASVLGEAGIPSVVFGPGGGRNHGLGFLAARLFDDGRRRQLLDPLAQAGCGWQFASLVIGGNHRRENIRRLKRNLGHRHLRGCAFQG